MKTYDRIKPPSKCAATELEDFYGLVVRGGKVEISGLESRIRRAKLLAFHYEDGALVGIAAIKRPTERYKKELFTKALVSKEHRKYSFELGWAFTLENRRGHHICSHLVEKTVGMCDSQNLYATTETTNSHMQSILMRNGFEKTGKPYHGRLDERGKGEYWLQLFTRLARISRHPYR